MTLYGRQIRVRVAGLLITEPRINFTIEEQSDSSQSSGSVKIYNLSSARSGQIYQRSENITIDAGYPDTIAIIFNGIVQRVRQPREGLSHITHIELGDRVHAVGNLGGAISVTYAGPVSVKEIIGDFADAMGMEVGPISNHGRLNGARVTDFSYFGSSRDGLRAILKHFNYVFFVDDNLIRFRGVSDATGDTTQTDAPTINVSPGRGLIGTPTPTDEGAECTMFLNPHVKRGGVLNLRSSTLSGRYRIAGVRHEADNWDGKFISWVDLRSL